MALCAAMAASSWRDNSQYELRGRKKQAKSAVYGASVPNTGLGDAVSVCSWSAGISHVPGDCRGAAPKCAAGKNQASFWAQQRCEEVPRLRRVLCVILWQGKALCWGTGRREGVSPNKWG